MNREAALDAFAGRSTGPVFGLSWLEPAVLRSLTWSQGIDDEAEALEAVASALSVGLCFVDARAGWARSAVRLLAASGCAVAWAVPGPLSRIADEDGLADVLRRSATDPGSLAFELDRAMHDVLDSAREGIALGADAIVVADDLASSSGWLLSPDFAMEALVPCFALVASLATSSGAAAIFHSDGDVRALFPALGKSGYRAVHLGGAGADEIEAALGPANRAGLMLLGGVRAATLSSVVPRSASEDLARLAAGGLLVICDDGGLTTADEVAALASLYDRVRAATR